MPLGYSNKATDMLTDFRRCQDRLGLDLNGHLADVATKANQTAINQLTSRNSLLAEAARLSTLARSPMVDLDTYATAGAISQQIEDSLSGAAERALQQLPVESTAISQRSLDAMTGARTADVTADLALFNPTRALDDLQNATRATTMDASLRALQESFASAATHDALLSVLPRFASFGSTKILNRALQSGHWAAVDTDVALGASTALADYASLMSHAGLADTEAFSSIRRAYDAVERSLRNRTSQSNIHRSSTSRPSDRAVGHLDEPVTHHGTPDRSQGTPLDVIEGGVRDFLTQVAIAKLQQLVDRCEFSAQDDSPDLVQWQRVPDLVCRLAFHYPDYAGQLAVMTGRITSLFALLVAAPGKLRNGGIEYLSVDDSMNIEDALRGFCMLLDEIESLSGR